jgi:hypothetical protein
MSMIHVRTVVLPDGKVEVSSPELPVGEVVDVTIQVAAKPSAGPGVLSYLKSLPPIHRTPEEWEQIEQDFQAERESWDR